VRKNSARAAAAEACATQSGITCGPTELPQANMPSREVSTADTAAFLRAMKPFSSVLMRRSLASFAAPSLGAAATESTTRSARIRR
jgi:hypothetical protein